MISRLHPSPAGSHFTGPQAQRPLMFITLLLSLLWGYTRAQAAVLRVSAAQSTSAPADGSSWAWAFPALQAAVEAAANGDAVWVAAGTYPGCVTLKSGVAVYGGFRGNEVEQSQ